MSLLTLALLALSASVAHGVQVNKRTFDLCTVCTGVVSEVKALLGAGSSVQQTVDQMLDTGCSAFNSHEAECAAIIDQFSTQIVSGLAAHAGPAQVCQKLNLCSSSASAAQSLLYVDAQTPLEPTTALRVQADLAHAAPPADGACSLCEAIVGFVESYVEQNNTQAQIQKQLDQLCGLTGPYEQICDNLVQQYLPQIIQYVEKQETPQQVCTKIGLCSSSKIIIALPLDPKVAARMHRFIAKPLVPAAPRDGGCSVCTAIVGFVESYVAQNQTEQHIAKTVDKLCKLTGPYEMVCDNLVQQYLPQIIQYLENKETPQQVCTKIGLCNAVAQPVVVVAKAPASGGTCSICESLVGFIEAYVEQNQTVQQIEQQLDQICTFTGPYAQICDNLVSQYVPQLIAYVEQDYTPQEACTDIGVCSSSKVSRKTLALSPNAGGACSICESIVGFIEAYVEQNQTVQQIEQQLDNVCQFTGPYEQICDNLVSQYVPQLIAYVEQDYTPQEACTDIGLCTNTKIAIAAAPKAGGLCSVCESIVGFVEAYVAQNQSEQQIEQQLDQLCQFTGPYATACDNLVSNYVPQLIAYVEQDYSPQEACTDIGICTSVAVKQTAPKAGGACSICESLVGFVEAYVAQNQTEQQIEQQLENVCQFTGPYEQICDNLVAQYVPQLIAYVEMDYSPEEACTDIGLCSSAKVTTKALVITPAPAPSPSPSPSFLCQACEYGVTYLEQYVNQNGTLGNITALAEKACNILPQQYRDQCTILVDMYVPQVIQYIENKETPQQVCTKIQLCGKSAAIVQQVAVEALVSAVVVPSASSGGCSMCEALVGLVESYVENNQTIQQINQQLDQLCTNLGPYAVMCQNLVDAYLPQIVQYLQQSESPQQVCGQVGLCDAMARMTKQIVAANAALNASPALCGLCKTVVSYVELFLAHGAGEAAIAKQLHSLCGLTQGFKMQCDNLVDSQLANIIQWIEDMKTPTEICALAKMCDAPTPAPTPSST